ncbi:MAG: amidohydrolase family protein [Chryseolinea sp.]
MKLKQHLISFCLVITTVVLISCSSGKSDDKSIIGNVRRRIIHELNESTLAKGDSIIAITGGMLIDGTGKSPIKDASIIIKNDKIIEAGERSSIRIPDDAKVIDARGMTILPGMFDAHYHNEASKDMPQLYVQHGITSVRDPGEWIESYHDVMTSGILLPRLFLTGPHINTFPPAYPEDAIIIQDNEEAKLAVDKLAHQGATAIKVYFGLSVGMIREVCKTAHAYGLPVTAHLEISNARDAIEAGLDGIEHVTSFGNVLIPPYDAEQYKIRVLADFNARKRGRYEMWNLIKLENNPAVDSLLLFLAHKKIFMSPTLAVFEKQSDHGDSVEVNAFQNMIRFVGMAKKAGVPIVVGSHTYVPYAENGFAYFRELELLHEAGLDPMEVIVAATMENARYFKVEERLGSIEPGKLADLVLIDGDPLKDIKSMRNVKRVMLNGKWLTTTHH